jgi:hypothetical protein
MSCLRSGCWGRRSEVYTWSVRGVDVWICAGCWLGRAIDRGGRGKLAIPARGIGTIVRVLRFLPVINFFNVKRVITWFWR